MQTIQRAALAPAEPSSADRRVASRASAYANEAWTDILQDTQQNKEAPKELKKTQEDGDAEPSTPELAQRSTRSHPTTSKGVVKRIRIEQSLVKLRKVHRVQERHRPIARRYQTAMGQSKPLKATLKNQSNRTPRPAP